MSHAARILATALACCAPAAASAQDSKIGQGPPPAWVVQSEPLPVPEDASGLVFIRVQDSEVHLDKDGQWTYVGQRVKLLNPQALQIGNLAIAWNPAVGAPIVHALKIHRGTTEIDVLTKTKFEVLRREDNLEQMQLNGILTATLQVPDLRVGDELEIAYTLPATDATLKGDNFGMLALAGTTLPGRYHLGLNWTEGNEPKIQIDGELPGTTTRTANGLDVRADNPPPASPPKDAPPRYGWQRIVEYSDFSSWQAVAARIAPLFETAATLQANSPLLEEADQIAAANASPMDRAAAALKLVQQQVRYIYVGLNGGNFTPASADVTWQRRYGDCKGKTALLLALLGRLGIEAEPVLVNQATPDDGLDQRLPNPALFDHVLVRATIDGQQYWLDGTLPAVATASIRPERDYQWVLPLGDDRGALEHLPWSPAEQPNDLNLYEIDARAGFDKPARIVTTSIQRGLVGLGQHIQFSALSHDQLLQALRNELAASPSWDTIEDVSYRYDVANRAALLTITGTGPIDWQDYGSGAKSLTLPGGGFNPPPKRQRPPDQDQAAPYYSAPDFNCYVTSVRFPEGTDPRKWDYNSTFDTQIFGKLYYRAFEKRDATIRMVRGSRVAQPEITAQTAAKDNERLAQFDNSKASIDYNPKGNVGTTAHPQTVPATWETDWAKSAQFCLPKDLRK